MSSFVSAETLWIDTPHGRLFTRRWFPAGVECSRVKPPIILFHDSLGCVELWRDFPERLCQATEREVIAYDRLGFGQSDAHPGKLPMHFIRDEAERFFALTLHGIRVAKAQFEKAEHIKRLEKYHGKKAQWVLSAWTDSWLSEAFSGWTIEDTIDSIHCPLLALHGEQDEYGSVLHPMRIARLTTAPGEYLILEDCHHVPHRKAPDVVLDAVDRLLRISR